MAQRDRLTKTHYRATCSCSLIVSVTGSRFCSGIVDGFCIWYKRLEVGVFQLPVVTEGEQEGVELDCSTTVDRLLGGLDLRNGRRRKAISTSGLKFFSETPFTLDYRRVVKTVGVMDDAHPLPNDLAECHQTLVGSFQASHHELEQKAVDSEKQSSELERVLDETAASYEELKEIVPSHDR